MALSTTLFLSALLFAPALARFDLARRLVCTQDDVYSLFHNATPSWIDPWCSSYIGLTDVQSTSNAYTNQFTTVTTTTTYTSNVHTTTLPDYIATVTTTIGAIQKRDTVSTPAPTPPAQLDQLYSAVPILAECDESPQNKTLISAVSSGCSCLFISPRTLPVYGTTTTTTTVLAIDYEATDIYVTKTGYSTKTVTVLPTPVGNSTSSGSIGILPSPVNSTSTGSGLPTSVPLNSTAAASPTSAPSGGPTLVPFSVCPARDGEIITESDGEQFQILCYTNFAGPTGIGLDEPTFGACLQQCALDNDGFSATRCYGVSYFANQIGPNCYLKTKAGVAAADYNPAYRIVSGILLLNTTNTTSSSITPSAAPTLPSNSSGTIGPSSGSSLVYPNITNGGDRNGNQPTGLPTSLSNITWISGPTGLTPSNSTASTTISSLGPTSLPNLVNSTTLFPTNPTSRSGPTAPTLSFSSTISLPTNSTSNLGPTAPPSPVNSTISLPTNPTSRSGPTVPPFSANSTSLLPTDPTRPGPTAPVWSGNSSASITASNSLNSTARPSIAPSPSYNITSTPSGFPSASSNYTNPLGNLTLPSNSRGFSTFPTTNASICISTQWMTAYTTECGYTSTIIVTSTASAPPPSTTRTLTETFTLTA